jgi:hypothetical protein
MTDANGIPEFDCINRDRPVEEELQRLARNWREFMRAADDGFCFVAEISEAANRNDLAEIKRLLANTVAYVNGNDERWPVPSFCLRRSLAKAWREGHSAGEYDRLLDNIDISPNPYEIEES